MSRSESQAPEAADEAAPSAAPPLEPDQSVVGDEPATLLSNSLWSFLAQAIGYGTAGLISILAIRSLTTAEWGNYATAIALISLLTIFSDLGLSALAMREMSTRPAEAQAIFGVGLRSVITTGLVGATVLVPLALALGYDQDVVHLLMLGAPAVVLQPVIAMTRAGFNARRQLRYVAQFNVLQAVCFGALAIVLLGAGLGSNGLVVAIVGGNAVAVAAALTLASSRLGLRPAIRVAKGTLWPFIRAASPIALVGGMAIIYDRLDVVLLSKLADASEVAIYSVPYTLAKLTWAIPSAIGAAFFPLYTRIRDESPDEASPAFYLIVRIFTYISVPTALLLSFAGEALLVAAFGERYADSAPVLTILAWSLVASFQNYVLWYGILAVHSERSVVPIQLSGLAVNLAANIVLIPRYGAMGSAWAFLLSDLVTTGGQFFLVHRRLHRVPVRRLVVRPLAAVGLGALAGAVLADVNDWLAGLAAATVAVVCLQSLAYVSRAEWRPLTQPLGALASRARTLFSAKA